MTELRHFKKGQRRQFFSAALVRAHLVLPLLQDRQKHTGGSTVREGHQNGQGPQKHPVQGNLTKISCTERNGVVQSQTVTMKSRPYCCLQLPSVSREGYSYSVAHGKL